ncbi:MAG: hypothetical protein MJ136_08060, partial [Clostridia bacterium]|nr:hypothetical protein [Clostridia bacterium]
LFEAKKGGSQALREKADFYSNCTLASMKVIFIKARVLFNMKNTALSRVGFGATMLSGSESVVAPIIIVIT